MEQWQDVASQQVKIITTRLSELLSRGLLSLKTELGVDLGLNPELIPPWVILLAACTGLVLMVVLWASLCRAAFKKQPIIKTAEDSVAEVKRATKPVKDEPKKKKKKSEKKSQPNGRAAVEAQEEEAVEEIVPHHHQPPPSEVKTEKAAEVKKSKKKAKQAVKEPAKIVTTDGKEPEEGTWETKVSNKEKREQRKKDKGSSDGSSSPGGGDSRVTTATEQPKSSPAAPPANQKKKKGGEVKSEKVEVEVPKVPVKAEPAAAHVPIAVVTKVTPQTVASKTVNWTNRESASLWGSEIDGSWTVIDRSSLGTFTGLGVPNAEHKSMSQLPWLNQPAVDDEWSGINGGGTDYNSDWNAPSEVWGNYEEPSPDPVPVEEPPVPEPDKNNLLIEAANDDDNEKEKEDITGDGAAKSKRKKKKKKKAAEEGATSGQGDETDKEAPAPVSSVKQPLSVQEMPASVQTVKVTASEMKAERNMKENVVQKPPVTQVPQKPADVEPTAKSNPASTQQTKPEESQASKPAKKKKARRET